MDDMDVESEELGGKRTFFVGEYSKYAWRKIFDPRQSGYELLNLYSEAITKMDTNPGVPKLFRDIFKNAYLPYRDPETLKSFLKIINEFEYTHSEKLGDAFEFLLSILGSQGDAGQFRTPRHIIDFMVEIIDPKKHEVILDPACGTAGFLISSYKHIVKQNSSNYLPDQNTVSTGNGTQSVNEVIITSNGYSGDKLTTDERKILANNIHGYDISPDMVRLSLVNMYLHGIKEPHISEYDTLTSEDHWNQYCDVILANPPFMSPKGGIRPHKRFSIPSNRSEVLFVDYIAEHLTPDGRAIVIVPEGIIFQSGIAYKNLRKMLVEKYLVGVISLPAWVFNPYSGVKTSILWLDKALAKRTDKIIFVKIENDGFDLGAQRRAIKDNDIPTELKFISQYKTSLINNNSTADIEILNARVVAKEEIYENKDYSLSGERYNHEVLKESIYPWVTLGSACTINPKKAEIKDKNQDMEVSFVPMSDLNENQASFEPKQKKKLLDVFNGYTYFQNNDVLLARVTPCFENGKAGLAKNLKNGIGFGSSEYIIFRASANVLPYWIYLAITSDTFRRIGKSKMTGTGGLQRVPIDFATTFNIPLPPVPIQEEIIEEIESYQKIIDGARQVVESYKPRIDIDPEWEMVELGEVCEIKHGYAFKSSDFNVSNDQSLPIVLKPGNFTESGGLYFNHKNTSRYSGNIDIDYLFKPGDLIIVMTDLSPKMKILGNTAIIADDNILHNQRIGKMIFKNKNLLGEFVHYLFYSESIKNRIKQNATGSLIKHTSPNRILETKIPIPPIDIQIEIIKRIKKEQEYININNQIIYVFEQKIKDRISKVWGE